jgi:N-acetylglucosamine kinase-like BadF-type ATPase
MAGILLGVDGGNTKTIAVVTTHEGSIAGVGMAGCSDIHNPSAVDAVAEVVRAVKAALAEARADAADLDATVFSLAGADWPEDFEFLRREIGRRLDLRVEPAIVNDAVGAIRGGTDDGVGVAVVCGTGGAVAARNAAGDVFHYGFWPDGTGAGALGQQALTAVWRADLGVGPETSLTRRALERWQCSDPLELLHAFTRLDVPAIREVEKASFAAAVLDEADAGDPVALELVTVAGRRLAEYARVAAARVGLSGNPFPLVLSGGVLRHPSRLMRDTIVAHVPEGVPVTATVEPVVGAVLLAADAVGTPIEREALGAAFLTANDTAVRR